MNWRQNTDKSAVKTAQQHIHTQIFFNHIYTNTHFITLPREIQVAAICFFFVPLQTYNTSEKKMKCAKKNTRHEHTLTKNITYK